MDKQIFIINGSGGVGKDTFVQFVSDALDGSAMNFSSVDNVKTAAKVLGWDGGKTEKDRAFLSDLKLLSTEYNDMPFQSMETKSREFHSSGAKLLFLHIREPEEIERAKLAFHAKTILIKRDSVQRITSNIADGTVFCYQYDIEVENNGDLALLREKAIEFSEDFNNGRMKNKY